MRKVMPQSQEQKREKDRIRQQERRDRGYTNTAPSHEIPSGVLLKPITNFPGYWAASDGTIWSQCNFHGGLRDVYRRLSPRGDKDGYLSVTLNRDGLRTTKRVSHIEPLQGKVSCC
jgi:hypothetical protein